MQSSLTYHIIRILLSTLIIVSLGRPLASTAFDNTGYLCNPSGYPPTAEADTKLKEFLIAVGEIETNDTDVQTEHCFDCLATPAAINAAFVSLSSTRFTLENDDRLHRNCGTLCTQRGPPLGGRAPPFFQ